MERYMYGYKTVNKKDKNKNDYGVFIFWGTGPEINDLVKIDEHIHLADMDDVKKLHYTLDQMIKDWGETDE